MRGRAVLVQGAVAAAALVVAAVVWLRPPPAGLPGEVPVAPLKHGEVKAVHWDDGSHRVDVFRGADAERTVWVRIATSPSILPPDGGVAADGGTTGDGGTARSPLRPDAGSPGMPLRPDGGVHGRSDAGIDLLKALREAPPPPERELKGNDTAVQIFDRLSPPMATRDLGVATPGRRTELGIDGSSKRLALDTTPGVTLSFVVSTPPGASGAYLLDRGGRLWVVQESLVQDLSAALSRLVDRRLHAFRSDEPDALQLQMEGRVRSFVVRKLQGATRVSPAEHPDAPSTEANAWADRAWRLAPLEVLGRGETPREGTPAIAIRLEYLRNRKPLGFLELGRAGTEWFGRTEHTAGWVRVGAQAAALRDQADRLEAGTPGPP